MSSKVAVSTSLLLAPAAAAQALLLRTGGPLKVMLACAAASMLSAKYNNIPFALILLWGGVIAAGTQLAVPISKALSSGIYAIDGHSLILVVFSILSFVTIGLCITSFFARSTYTRRLLLSVSTPLGALVCVFCFAILLTLQVGGPAFTLALSLGVTFAYLCCEVVFGTFREPGSGSSKVVAIVFLVALAALPLVLSPLAPQRLSFLSALVVDVFGFAIGAIAAVIAKSAMGQGAPERLWGLSPTRPTLVKVLTREQPSMYSRPKPVLERAFSLPTAIADAIPFLFALAAVLPLSLTGALPMLAAGGPIPRWVGACFQAQALLFAYIYTGAISRYVAPPFLYHLLPVFGTALLSVCSWFEVVQPLVYVAGLTMYCLFGQHIPSRPGVRHASALLFSGLVAASAVSKMFSFVGSFLLRVAGSQTYNDSVLSLKAAQGFVFCVSLCGYVLANGFACSAPPSSLTRSVQSAIGSSLGALESGPDGLKDITTHERLSLAARWVCSFFQVIALFVPPLRPRSPLYATLLVAAVAAQYFLAARGAAGWPVPLGGFSDPFSSIALFIALAVYAFVPSLSLRLAAVGAVFALSVLRSADRVLARPSGADSEPEVEAGISSALVRRISSVRSSIAITAAFAAAGATFVLTLLSPASQALLSLLTLFGSGASRSLERIGSGVFHLVVAASSFGSSPLTGLPRAAALISRCSISLASGGAIALALISAYSKLVSSTVSGLAGSVLALGQAKAIQWLVAGTAAALLLSYALIPAFLEPSVSGGASGLVTALLASAIICVFPLFAANGARLVWYVIGILGILALCATFGSSTSFVNGMFAVCLTLSLGLTLHHYPDIVYMVYTFLFLVIAEVLPSADLRDLTFSLSALTLLVLVVINLAARATAMAKGEEDMRRGVITEDARGVYRGLAGSAQKTSDGLIASAFAFGSDNKTPYGIIPAFHKRILSVFGLSGFTEGAAFVNRCIVLFVITAFFAFTFCGFPPLAVLALAGVCGYWSLPADAPVGKQQVVIIALVALLAARCLLESLVGLSVAGENVTAVKRDVLLFFAAAPGVFLLLAATNAVPPVSLFARKLAAKQAPALLAVGIAAAIISAAGLVLSVFSGTRIWTCLGVIGSAFVALGRGGFIPSEEEGLGKRATPPPQRAAPAPPAKPAQPAPPAQPDFFSEGAEELQPATPEPPAPPAQEAPSAPPAAEALRASPIGEKAE